MYWKLLFFLTSVLFSSLNGISADYSVYYQLINTAEEKFVKHQDKSCFKEYDEAFKSYKPFLKDPFIAAQIAIHLKDTVKFYDYLKICFQNGMPITAIHVSPLINTINHHVVKSRINELYTSFYKEFNSNERIQDKLCLFCYQSDSTKVRIGGRSQQFHESENNARKYILDSFLVDGKFPNELLVGITTNKNQAAFFEKFKREDVFESGPFGNGIAQYEEHELRRKCPYNIILHSRCFYTEHKELFLRAMRNGYIHPKEIGILEETAILWHANDESNGEETCGKAVLKICYNIFNRDSRKQHQVFDDSEAGLRTVEENRKNIFMQKYHIDVQKKKLEKEIGIKFFFDFVDR